MGNTGLFAMTGDIGQQINELSSRVIFVSAVGLLVLIALAAFAKSKYSRAQPVLFGLLIFTVLASTFTLFGSSIYLDAKSDTNGPVHWQAGVEYWACGVQLDIRDPTSVFSDRVGTPSLYEENDQQMHVDGALVNTAVDASFGKFMRVIGGEISSSRLSLPVTNNVIEKRVDGDSTDPLGESRVSAYTTVTDEGKIVTVTNRNTCDNKPAEVQTYVYHYNKATKTYTQKKLSNPESYVISPESRLPGGDCIIVEFGVKRDRTDRLCAEYGVHDEQRCTSFGVKPFDPSSCSIHETLPTPERIKQ